MYCSPEDVRRLTQLLSGDPDEAITPYIEKAGARIDAYLSRRYAVPLAVVPPIIASIAADMAASFILDEHTTERLKDQTTYGEVLFSFASPAASAFEQHREYTGITWRLAQRFSVETGVMHQAVKSTAGPFRHNVIIQLTLRNNAPLRDLFGWMRGN